jgi:hypothetical protein
MKMCMEEECIEIAGRSGRCRYHRAPPGEAHQEPSGEAYASPWERAEVAAFALAAVPKEDIEGYRRAWDRFKKAVQDACGCQRTQDRKAKRNTAKRARKLVHRLAALAALPKPEQP